MATGRRMGQKPHPFTVKVVDETDGQYLTSGRNCYRPGAKSRDGPCSGVFRAAQKGIYKFTLIGSQIWD